MINFTQENSIVADNSITINGAREYKLTDAETEKLMSIINGMISSRTASGVSTPTAEISRTDVPTPKEYEHTDEDYTDYMWVLKDNTVRYVKKNVPEPKPGKKPQDYVNHRGVRQVLNARLRKSGFEYDKENSVWVLVKGGRKSPSGAKKFVDGDSGVVTADELNTVYDKWTEQSSKRAARASKRA